MHCLFWLSVPPQKGKKASPEAKKPRQKMKKGMTNYVKKVLRRIFETEKVPLYMANNLFFVLTSSQRSRCSLFETDQLNYCVLGQKCLSQMHTRVLLKHTVVSCLTDGQSRSGIGRLMNGSSQHFKRQDPVPTPNPIWTGAMVRRGRKSFYLLLDLCPTFLPTEEPKQLT